MPAEDNVNVNLQADSVVVDAVNEQSESIESLRRRVQQLEAEIAREAATRRGGTRRSGVRKARQRGGATNKTSTAAEGVFTNDSLKPSVPTNPDSKSRLRGLSQSGLGNKEGGKLGLIGAIFSQEGFGRSTVPGIELSSSKIRAVEYRVRALGSGRNLMLTLGRTALPLYAAAKVGETFGSFNDEFIQQRHRVGGHQSRAEYFIREWVPKRFLSAKGALGQTVAGTLWGLAQVSGAISTLGLSMGSAYTLGLADPIIDPQIEQISTGLDEVNFLLNGGGTIGRIVQARRRRAEARGLAVQQEIEKINAIRNFQDNNIDTLYMMGFGSYKAIRNAVFGPSLDAAFQRAIEENDKVKWSSLKGFVK
jgi:hypothetical protein